MTEREARSMSRDGDGLADQGGCYSCMDRVMAAYRGEERAILKPHLRRQHRVSVSNQRLTHAGAEQTRAIHADSKLATLARTRCTVLHWLNPHRPRSTMRPSPTLVALISASLAAGVLAQVPQPPLVPLASARGIERSIGDDASSSPPLPHSTIAAAAYQEDTERSVGRSATAAYQYQLAAPALFANIAPGDRPPECPPCNPFNCVLPAFPCLNTGTSAWMKHQKKTETADVGLSLRQANATTTTASVFARPGSEARIAQSRVSPRQVFRSGSRYRDDCTDSSELLSLRLSRRWSRALPSRRRQLRMPARLDWLELQWCALLSLSSVPQANESG